MYTTALFAPVHMTGVPPTHDIEYVPFVTGLSARTVTVPPATAYQAASTFSAKAQLVAEPAHTVPLHRVFVDSLDGGSPPQVAV